MILRHTVIKVLKIDYTTKRERNLAAYLYFYCRAGGNWRKMPNDIYYFPSHCYRPRHCAVVTCAFTSEINDDDDDCTRMFSCFAWINWIERIRCLTIAEKETRIRILVWMEMYPSPDTSRSPRLYPVPVPDLSPGQCQGQSPAPDMSPGWIQTWTQTWMHGAFSAITEPLVTVW